MSMYSYRAPVLKLKLKQEITSVLDELSTDRKSFFYSFFVHMFRGDLQCEIFYNTTQIAGKSINQTYFFQNPFDPILSSS